MAVHNNSRYCALFPLRFGCSTCPETGFVPGLRAFLLSVDSTASSSSQTKQVAGAFGCLPAGGWGKHYRQGQHRGNDSPHSWSAGFTTGVTMGHDSRLSLLPMRLGTTGEKVMDSGELSGLSNGIRTCVRPNTQHQQ